MEQENKLRSKQLKLYKPPPKEDQSKNYRKLIAVIIISVLFIAVEAIGGIISGSISVISDSVHLLTDLVGFVLAFVFIWYSGKRPTKRMNFGYHRTELLGAIGNLFIIWALALFLMVQAFSRIINKVYVQDPLVMLIISGVGLPINIIMFFVLHEGGHSHGLMSQQCGHEHPDAVICDEELCEDVECLISQQYIDHCHKKMGEKQQIHMHNQKVIIDDNKNIIRQKNSESQKIIMEDEDLEDNINMKSKLHDKKKEDQNQSQNPHGHHSHDHHSHDHHSHDHHSHDHHSHDHHSHPHNHGHSHENMSMKAAVVHALSDIIFSVGLLIASIIIFIWGSEKGATVTEWNDWHYFDPGMTILFTILVFISTWPITKNCYYIIMQSTPPHISLDELEKQFLKVKGVTQVHDLHIWDLRPGKTILTAHVFSENNTERYVLKELTDVCRHRKIYHSTFQVQEQAWKDHQEYILCDHDIH